MEHTPPPARAGEKQFCFDEDERCVLLFALGVALDQLDQLQFQPGVRRKIRDLATRMMQADEPPNEPAPSPRYTRH